MTLHCMFALSLTVTRKAAQMIKRQRPTHTWHYEEKGNEQNLVRKENGG